MDPSTVAKLTQLKQLADAGVLSQVALETAQQKCIDADLYGQQYGPTGLPATFSVTGTAVFGNAPQPQQQVVQQQVVQQRLPAAAPQLQLAPPPVPAGPTAQQVLAQQQLETLQQAQAAQLEQMQPQMQEQMASAQAAITAAAPEPVAAPVVQFREQAKAGATRSTSSGEKQPAAHAAAAAAAATPAAAAARKASEKQSTDLGPAQTASGGSERRAIVVMFCDICDSTAISESLDAEDVREVVLVYQQFVGEVLVSLGGHIAQYLGDGILTYFGFPESDPDAAQHAVEAGLEIIAALPKLNRELESKGLKLSKPLRIRLGMHSGSVVIGAMGGGNRTETLALGDVPNIAARMESLSPVNGMAITPEIKDAVEHKFVCKPLVIEGKSSHFVKGISQPIEVFTIDSHKNAGAGAATVDLVGRKAELGQLQDMWQMLQMGQGQAVVVTGGAGIGKTALTSAFAQNVRAEESKPVVMLLKASEHRKSSPLYTAAQVLKRWASAELGERAQVRRALKDAGLEDRADELSAPLLAVLGIDGADGSIPFEDSKAALLGLLTALPAWKPLVIVVEDTEQIDDMSLALFDELAKKLGSLKLFLCMCWRNENGLPGGSCLVDWMDEGDGVVDGQHIHIGKMNAAEAEELALAVAEGVLLPKEVLDHIAKHGEGVPLHLEQLTRSVLSADVLKLSARGGAYELTGKLSDLALPTSLENAIRANIDALGKKQPAVKLLLELCSVLGGEFKMAVMQPLWQLADGGSDADLQLALMIAMKKKMLTSVSSKGYAPAGRNRKSSVGENMQFQFVHLRILDVCRSSVLKARSKELHQQCSEVLSADAKTVEPEVLARHLDEAEQHERALGYWRMALDNCKRASGDVRPFVTACLAALDRLELEGPLSDNSVNERLNALNALSLWFSLRGDAEEGMAESAKMDVICNAIMAKYDNLRDIPNADTRLYILKALWAPTIIDQCNRMGDASISGLVEVPSTNSKQLQLSVDYAGSHTLEALHFGILFCAAGHEVAVGPDTANYKQMPGFEVHKKLRPGKPESEQWFHPGRKEFVPYDLSRVDNIVDLATIKHAVETWNFEEHAEAGMMQFNFPFIAVAPANTLAFMGDVDCAQIPWDKSVSVLPEHKESGGTTWGLHRWFVHELMAGSNIFPLCRFEETKKVMVEDGMLYNSDDGVVPKGYLWDVGSMAVFGCGDDGNFLVPFASGIIWGTKLNALMVGAHTLSTEELAVLKLPSPERLLPAYDEEQTWNDDEGSNIMSEFHGHMCPLNFMAAEIYLQLDRFVDALAHNARVASNSNGILARKTNAWQRGRILAAQRLAEGSGAPWSEIVALFEKTAAYGSAWGTPLMVVFALKDMLALVPAAALGDADARRRTQSRLEESLFELTMEKDTALKRHLESGEAYMPRNL